MAWFRGNRGASAPQQPDRRPAVDREAALAQVAVYEEQRAVLERSLGSDPESPWVSKIGAVQRPDGTVYTMTTWGENVTTLLPDRACRAVRVGRRRAARCR